VRSSAMSSVQSGWPAMNFNVAIKGRYDHTPLRFAHGRPRHPAHMVQLGFELSTDTGTPNTSALFAPLLYGQKTLNLRRILQSQSLV
jgi:hypothetical protein